VLIAPLAINFIAPARPEKKSDLSVGFRHPFLRHEGPEEEFAAIIAAGHTNLDFQVS
jgi:hypothetical protein